MEQRHTTMARVMSSITSCMASLQSGGEKTPPGWTSSMSLKRATARITQRAGNTK